METKKAEPLTLTLREVSERYGISLYSLRGYVRQKRIPVYKIGRAYRVKTAEFAEWIDSKKVE